MTAPSAGSHRQRRADLHVFLRQVNSGSGHGSEDTLQRQFTTLAGFLSPTTPNDAFTSRQQHRLTVTVNKIATRVLSVLTGPEPQDWRQRQRHDEYVAAARILLDSDQPYASHLTDPVRSRLLVAVAMQPEQQATR